MSRRILILTAGFGEGHNAAARNLECGLRAVYPDAACQVVDVFTVAYGWLNRLSQDMYVAAISYAPYVWSAFFQLLDRSSVIDDQIGLLGASVKTMRKLIDDFRPDVVVSVYPGYGPLVKHATRKSGRKFAFVTLVTDSLTVNAVWHRAGSDWFVVPNEPTAEVMAKAGVDRAKLRVLGFPVPLHFGEIEVPRQVPGPGEKWRILYMIHSMAHRSPAIVRRLGAMKNVRLAVTVGRKAALGRQLAALAKAEGFELEIHGWTPRMPELMAGSHVLIGKAGGASTQETLAAGTPMIINQIVPGQEEGNARLVTESHAGVVAETPDAIESALNAAFANDGALWKQWEAAARGLGHPHAAVDVARFVMDPR